MLALFCWMDFECWAEVIRSAVEVAVDTVMNRIFQPVIDAIAAALGQLLTTMATFWIGIDSPRPDEGVTGQTVDWLQSRLRFFVVAGATLSVIIAGMKMTWEQRGEPARELLKSLLTLVLVMGMATAVVSGLTAAGDKFSECVINASITPGLGEDPAPESGDRLHPPPSGGAFSDASCNRRPDSATDFGKNMLLLLFVVSGPVLPMGVMMTMVMGMLAVVASLLQVMMIVVRNCMLVLLMGSLPLAAAATNTEMGRSWFRRSCTWLVAALLYKPVAALIYAASLRLASGNPLRSAAGQFDWPGLPVPVSVGPLAALVQVAGGVWSHAALALANPAAAVRGIVSSVTGLTMMATAVFALPALSRAVTPLVNAAVAGDLLPGVLGGGAKLLKALGKATELGGDGPTGARNVPQTRQVAQPSPGQPGSSGAQGAIGAPGAPGAVGAGGASAAGAGGAGGAATSAGSAAAGAATAGIATVAIEAAKAVKQAADTVQESVSDAVDASAAQGEDGSPRGSDARRVDEGPSGSA